MKIYESISDLEDIDSTVISIGKFDGTHIGHIAIFQQMFRIAKAQGLKTLAITFSNSPMVANPLENCKRIYTQAEKREHLEKIGLDYLLELPFDKALQHMSGEEFLRNVLIDKLHMKVMVCGSDCAFGYRKSGNLALLERFKEELGYEYIVIDKIRDEQEKDISSSYIRHLLEDGKIEEVNRLTEFSIRGIVEVGNRIGTTIGFPTANIFPDDDKILPKPGVYAGKTRLLSTGEEFSSLTNIGTNPSIKEDKKGHILRVETYLFDFDRDIYGEEIEVFLQTFIRGEMKFSGLEALQRQIQADRTDVERFHKTGKIMR